MEEELDPQLVLADKAQTIISQFEEAKKKINSAVKELRENNNSSARFPCLISGNEVSESIIFALVQHTRSEKVVN